MSRKRRRSGSARYDISASKKTHGFSTLVPRQSGPSQLAFGEVPPRARLALLLGLIPVAANAQDCPKIVSNNSPPSVVADLRALGAKCDGVTDDTVAGLAAMAMAATARTNAVVHTPAGRCLFRQALRISLSTSAVEIRGEGADVSEWLFTGGGDGLDVVLCSAGWWVRNNASGQTGASVAVTGLGLINADPAVRNTATAIRVTGDNVTGRPSPNTSFERVAIHGVSAPHGWGVGIDMHNVGQTVLRDIVYTGANQSYSGTAIVISGVPTTNEMVNHKIDNPRLTFAHTGIQIGAGVQGVTITNGDINAVVDGVAWELAPGTPEDSLIVANTRLNYTEVGVKAANIYDVTLVGNYFLPSGPGTIGASIVSGALLVVANNQFRGASEQDTGLFIDRAAAGIPVQYGSAVTGNVFANLGKAALAFSRAFTGPVSIGSNVFSSNHAIYASKPAAVAMLANLVDGATVIGDAFSPTVIHGIGSIPLGHLLDSDIVATNVANGFAITEPQFRSGDLLKCGGTLASGAITLPQSPSQGQQYTVAAQCSISAIKWLAPGGAAIVNAPAALVQPAGSATFIFDVAGNAWFRWH